MSAVDEEPLQQVLAGVHAVVYGYAVAGARLGGADRRRAQRRWEAHRRTRDEIVAALRDLGAEPVQTSPAYALPAPVDTARDAVVLITLLEERLAALWADAVLTLVGDRRARAVAGLQESAVEAARWRGGSVPFPGLPERVGMIAKDPTPGRRDDPSRS